MSSFYPLSASALRHGLFRSPDTLLSLRYEAAERFLHWREVERAVESIHTGHRETIRDISEKLPVWDKARWEAEWEPQLSRDVASRLQEDTVISKSINASCWAEPVFIDPLHFSALVTFCLSLFGPAKSRLQHSVSKLFKRILDNPVRVVMIGSFCVGIGVGLVMK